MPMAAKSSRALGFFDRFGGEREDRAGRIFLIVLSDRVQDRQRRAVQAPRNPPRNFLRPASRDLREHSRASQNLLALHLADLRKIRSPRELILMPRDESLDAAQQKPHAALAVGKHNFVDLWFYFFPGVVLESIDLDFAVEVTDVGDNSAARSCSRLNSVD